MIPSALLMKEKVIQFLRWTERWTETDMLYATKGGFWIIFSKIGVALIASVKMLAFGHWVDQSVYGTYSFVISMAGILAIFSLPGIETSLIKAVAQKKDGTLNLGVREKLKFSLIGSFASLVAAGWYLYRQNTDMVLAFTAVAIFLPFKNSFNLFSSFWIGKKNFEKLSKYLLATNTLTALAMLPVIAFTNNPLWIIIALFASHSLFNGIFLFKTLQQKENDEKLPEAISFGKSLTLMGAIGQFASHVDKVILWKFFGPVQLAIYSFAQIPIQLIQGMIPIGELALPKIGEKGVGNMKEGLIKKFKKLFFVSAPMTIGAVAIAPYFYRFFLPQYVDSVPYFQAFSFLILLSPFALLGAALIAEMKKREIYTIQISIPILKIALFLALIPFFGIWGVILAIIISHIANGALSFYFFMKIS